jgi:hypothetical protein
VSETLLDVARNILVGAGLFLALLAIARRLPARTAVGIGLEYWIAGGLLKLSSAIVSWTAIATVVVIITIRKVAVTALPKPPPMP